MKGFWDKAQKYPYLSDSEADGIAYVDIDGKMRYIPVKGDFVKAWTPAIVDMLDDFLDGYFAAIDEGEARRRKWFPEPKAISELHGVYREWLYLGDDGEVFIDVILASSLDREIPGDSIWLMPIANPGGTKTVIASSLSKYHRVYTVDSVTRRGLVSGYRLSKKDDDKRAGILQHLNNKVLVIKDFTTILNMPEKDRTEFFGTLRSAYDGEYEQAFGTFDDKLSFPSKIGLIACCTPIIDRYTKMQSQLGERFLKVRHFADPQKMMDKAFDNEGQEELMKEALRNAVKHYFETLNFDEEPTINEKQARQIKALARIIVKMRTRVFGEKANGRLISIEPPNVEYPTRPVKQLKRLAKLLAILYKEPEVNQHIINILYKVVMDSADQKRRKVVEAIIKLSTLNNDIKQRDILDRTQLSEPTVYNELMKLKALKVVSRVTRPIKLKEPYLGFFILVSRRG